MTQKDSTKIFEKYYTEWMDNPPAPRLQRGVSW